MQDGKKFPCYGCEKRHSGCHADCEEYIEARNKMRRPDEVKDKVMKGYEFYVIKPRINKDRQKRKEKLK